MYNTYDKKSLNHSLDRLKKESVSLDSDRTDIDLEEQINLLKERIRNTVQPESGQTDYEQAIYFAKYPE